MAVIYSEKVLLLSKPDEKCDGQGEGGQEGSGAISLNRTKNRPESGLTPMGQVPRQHGPKHKNHSPI